MGKPKPPLEISPPLGLEQKIHIDSYLQWNVEDPTKSFTLRYQLGEGSFGWVFAAEQRETQKRLAVKIMKIPLEENSKEIKFLKSEIQILQQCRHPSIVSYWGCCFAGRFLWLLMDLCDLGSVIDFRRSFGPFKEKYLKVILHQTLHGLRYLHSLNILHRDIKGQNLLLTSKGEVKIADFGLSEKLKPEGVKTTAGTLGWMAPEVVAGKRFIDMKSDIWSVGITILELLEGTQPFSSLSLQEVIHTIKTGPPPSPPSHTSRELKQLIQKKDPAERLSCDELLSLPFFKNTKTLNEFKNWKRNTEKQLKKMQSEFDEQKNALAIQSILECIEDDYRENSVPPPQLKEILNEKEPLLKRKQQWCCVLV